MNPLHSKDIEMSDPPKLSTIKREQSQDFQSEFIARRKAVHDLEAIVNKLYEQAQHVHAKALELIVGARPPFPMPTKQRGSLEVTWVFADDGRKHCPKPSARGIAARLPMAEA